MIWVLTLVAVLVPAMILGTPVSEPFQGKLAEDKEIIELVKKACTMHGAEDKIPQVMVSIEKFEKCYDSLTKDMESITALSAEVKRKDDIGGIMKKYCALAPEIKNCTYSLLDLVAMCGDKDEHIDQEDVEKTRHFVDQLVSYVCHKDGERITSFLKEDGIQCIQKNIDELNKCTAFIADQIEGDDDEDNSEENDVCEVFEHTSSCILSSMDDCAEKPVKITKDLSAHLRKAMNCTEAEDVSFNVYKHWLQARIALN